MNAAALYKFLYDWASSVVTPTPVIRAYQNGSKPSSSYIAIEDDQNWKPFGRPTNYAKNVDDITYDYACCPVFWEVGGFGDTLRALVENLATLKTKALFKSAGIGFLTAPTIMTMPWLSPDTEFIREHRMELNLSIARGSKDPDLTYISTVEFINNIGGQS